MAEESGVTYVEIHDLEAEFDAAESATIRYQYNLTKPLFEKRTRITSKIPNFWALVLEQSPEELDQHIQTADSALFAASLTSVNVSRFEIEDRAEGEARSVAITFEFGDNEYFTDKSLTKKFWWRYDEHGWSGLVSEPVKIHWKPGKDLTNGLLDLVLAAWAESKTVPKKDGKASFTPKQKLLAAKIESVGTGGQTFFNWFGFCGARLSAEESAANFAKRQAERETRKTGAAEANDDDESDDEDDELDEDLEDDLEIFPDGDNVAVAISDDLWPGALQYFLQAQEIDAMSDADFEDISDDDEDMDGDEAPALHKHKHHKHKGGCC